MSKFTPGPWRITTDAQGFPQHLVAEGYTTVCSFLTSVKRMCPSEQIDANARLIAAAPALYEALKKCANVCAGETTTKRGLIEALESAKAALALVGDQT